MLAFCLAQLVSSIIAAFAGESCLKKFPKMSTDWWRRLGLHCHRTHLRWMDRHCMGVEYRLGEFFSAADRDNGLTSVRQFFPLDGVKFAMKFLVKKFRSGQAAKRAAKIDQGTGVPMVRTQSRAASINQSLYSNRTNFLTKATRRMGLGKKVSVSNNDLQRFSSYQAAQSGAVIARSASRPQ